MFALTPLPTCNFYKHQSKYTTTELCANSSFDQLRPNEAVFSFHWLQWKVNFFVALMLKASGAFRCAIIIKFYRVKQIKLSHHQSAVFANSTFNGRVRDSMKISAYSWSRWTFLKLFIHSTDIYNEHMYFCLKWSSFKKKHPQ